MMDLDLFLHHLHFQSDLVVPENWEVDWSDAPLPYKIYRDLPEVSLAHDIPFSLKEKTVTPAPLLNTISYFLWYVYGLSQLSQTALPSADEQTPVETIQSFRRFAPSGGALYPNELYVYLKIEDLPDGIYHYDVVHHRLLLLREGHFDSYLTRALGCQIDMESCFGAVLITTMFWKNFFKYNNFSYRLQGLDTGALIGQLLEAAKKFRFSPSVHFQFLDQAINHLLGLNSQEESSYAVIPVSAHKKTTTSEQKSKEISASVLCKEIPQINPRHYQRSQKVLPFPEITQINQSSMFPSTGLFQLLKKEKEETNNQQAYLLPEVELVNYDLEQACRRRHSPEMDFIPKRIDRVQVSSLLKETVDAFACHNDLDSEKEQPSRVSIYGCFYNVAGIPNGAYRYDSTIHSLFLRNEGDFRLPLQTGMTLDNINLHQVPMCLHIIGDRSHYKSELGYRGYRIQHMEAGMLLQRLLLTASALGMNGHPLLGFDVSGCDQIYELEHSNKTTLIQIPVGFHRPKSWLTGNLHE